MKFTVKKWLNEGCNRKLDLFLICCVSLDPYLLLKPFSNSSFLLSSSSTKKRFLRCSPFDDFRLWKSQVDNGSKKGGERLSILTRSLLLRRTKDQLDSTGQPLVISLYVSLGEAREGGWYVLPLAWTAICFAPQPRTVPSACEGALGGHVSQPSCF